LSFRPPFVISTGGKNLIAPGAATADESTSQLLDLDRVHPRFFLFAGLNRTAAKRLFNLATMENVATEMVVFVTNTHS